MTHGFDKDYWELHWDEGAKDAQGSMGDKPPNPYLADEIGSLTPGTALDAGCGAGAEAIWLASAGWHVTAADISSVALARAAERAGSSGVTEGVKWVEADLGTWDPGERFDLVTTHYAHPEMPQLDFYVRIAEWVAPGGTLLIVGHRHTHDDDEHGHGHGDGHQPPAKASVTAAAITARLADGQWEIGTAAERDRTLIGSSGQTVTLHDVVVCATRHR